MSLTVKEPVPTPADEIGWRGAFDLAREQNRRLILALRAMIAFVVLGACASYFLWSSMGTLEDRLDKQSTPIDNQNNQLDDQVKASLKDRQAFQERVERKLCLYDPMLRDIADSVGADGTNQVPPDEQCEVP